ncbi:MAG: Coenzyme F420:L-glutamate ligase [Alphaproteobacteria bacterium MarineAlpha11_Bin1]|nr:MAG: Coenzyme F420:L-glutamate ligase [Alphaproteobacteria bacterium MarineAlpha11_Bin1]|tara:strand:- start:7116 stop:7934 length:819 start_codon:yes stop_codon:yes gene_type:complete
MNITDTIVAKFLKRYKNVSDLSRRLELYAPEGLPEIKPMDPLAQIIAKVFPIDAGALKEGDILVIAQKVVSKSEGRRVRIADVSPSEEANALAIETGKDPRLVELILQESIEIVRKRPGLIIARQKNGCVVANAAIDLSNTGDDGTAVLLPEDPDASAMSISQELEDITGLPIAVIVIDSMGRAWRNGTIGTAIGCYGLPALFDRRGQQDRSGMELQSSEIALADEIASAASILMGQGDEGLPVVRIRGLNWIRGKGVASDLVRPRTQDLFS